MEISKSASATPAPEWRTRLDFAVQCVGFQQQLEAMQESGSAVIVSDAGAGSAAASSADLTDQAGTQSSSVQNIASARAAASAEAPIAPRGAVQRDAFGRTPEEARAQVTEWQQQEQAIDVLRRQMGLPPINRGYNADYNPQNLDLKTMQPHGWVPVDPAALAREQSIKDAGVYLNDPRQYMGKPIIEAFGFDPDVIEEARRRAGSTTESS